MQAKMDSIVSIGTFKLVHPPHDHKPIGCKWVFHVKRTTTSKISHYKARLVAQGFTQKPSIDFTKTFTPVTKTDSICLLLTFATANDFEIHQVDVKSAFLNGKLKETIFMCQLKGFIAKGKKTGSGNLTRHFMGYANPPTFGTWNFKMPCLSLVSNLAILIPMSSSSQTTEISPSSLPMLTTLASSAIQSIKLPSLRGSLWNTSQSLIWARHITSSASRLLEIAPNTPSQSPRKDISWTYFENIVSTAQTPSGHHWTP